MRDPQVSAGVPGGRPPSFAANAGSVAVFVVEDFVEGGRGQHPLTPFQELLRVGAVDALFGGRIECRICSGTDAASAEALVTVLNGELAYLS